MEKQVVAEGPIAAMIPDGVRVGDEIYLSGVVSIDENMEPVGAGDFLAQVKQVYANIETALEPFGARLDNVVKETVFVIDMSMPQGSEDAPWEEYMKTRAEAFGTDYPEVAQSLIGVKELVLPDLLLEVEVVARV